MSRNNIITNQRQFCPPQLLVSLAYRIDVHYFYLITLIWLPNNLKVLTLQHKYDRSHMLQYKRRKQNYLKTHLFMSYTVERIGIHHVATSDGVSDVENVLPMVTSLLVVIQHW
jgi:hypothetical protein